MIDRFLAFSKENSLITKDDSVLVGVSGGIDSAVLLNILKCIQEKLHLELAIAHVNYGLRTESDRDERLVENLAKKYDTPLFSKKSKLTGSNLEERARDIRYSFFKKLTDEQGFQKIAVAHHKNDLVETFFLNAARGSGLTGLISMKPKTESLIRPLLFATRKEIEKYAQKNKLSFVKDVTNRDISIKRNFIRHKTIPSMQKINPKLVETVANEIENLREADSLIREITTKHYKKIAKEEESSVVLSIKLLHDLHPYIQSEILRQAILFVKGSLRNISRKNIMDILKLTQNSFGTKEIILPQRLIAKRIYDKLTISERVKSPLEKPKNTRLKMGNEVFFGDWRLFLGEKPKKDITRNENLVFLDIKKTPTLYVRCKKPGDRIAIGKGKTKSLQDLFVDAKIPRDKRKSYPIIVTENDKVVLVPGIRQNPYYKPEIRKSERIILETKEGHEETN